MILLVLYPDSFEEIKVTFVVKPFYKCQFKVALPQHRSFKIRLWQRIKILR